LILTGKSNEGAATAAQNELGAMIFLSAS